MAFLDKWIYWRNKILFLSVGHRQVCRKVPSGVHPWLKRLLTYVPTCALAELSRVVQSIAMRTRAPRSAGMEPRITAPRRRFFRPSQLRKMKGTEQVAAVCYRIRSSEPEFLLVRTRGGRWTFPKGAIESGLTPAQSAALEAFEEAGVHGRMEETCFTRYTHRKRGGKQRQFARKLSVQAHLCEVVRLGRPKESDRNPTWFSVEKTRRRLRQDRAPSCAAELLRIVDLAVVRIRRLSDGRRVGEDWGRASLEAAGPAVAPNLVLTVRERRRLSQTSSAMLQAGLNWLTHAAYPARQLGGTINQAEDRSATANRRVLVRMPRLTGGHRSSTE